MHLLERLRRLATARGEILGEGVEPFGIPVESLVSATEAHIHGRSVLLAGTNNYLGLTLDPRCVGAGVRALEREGTGTTGSRMANGSYSGHLALEAELSDFYGRAHGMIFSTGYLANLGMITALVGPGDTVVLDSDAHASIYDGARLSGADIMPFRHNDPVSLDKRLTRLGEEGAARTLVVVEGIYSMLGDRAPLAEIADAVRRHGALLMVDEAHSLGVLGERGRGLAEEAGVEDQVDFIVGTFSKSLGGVGGFCVSDHEELEMIRYASRPYIFTASPPPSVVASTRQALQILRMDPRLRALLWENARRLYAGLEEMGYRLGPDVSPVVAVILSSSDEALRLWRSLAEDGIYVNLMLPPATPANAALVRCSVSAAHTPEQIDTICRAFARFRSAAVT
ncbi:MAG: aminotransferase class I/II-fold pyridoxal phosphate-dependent enzyme [Gemmatimonadota bacterium]